MDNIYYTLVSFIRNDLKILEVSQNLNDLTHSLNAHSIEWICDEVGKNNYVNTLDDDTPVENYSPGYYLKRGVDKKRINVYFNKINVEKGWLGNASNVETEYIGYFAVLPVGICKLDVVKKKQLQSDG